MRIGSAHLSAILRASLIAQGILNIAPFLVIVRRVVAARQHTAGKAAVSPRGNQGFHSHAQSTSRTQPLPAYGEKEADSADFPERPGAKKTKRGGFWARFKCW